MRRTCCINLLTLFLILFIIFMLKINQVENAIIPPPWSNPEINPCANLSNGWQLIYWRPLKKCFKIFTLGYPCPETKELVPIEGTLKLMETYGIHAECRCPPGTLEFNATCAHIYEKGPCEQGAYVTAVEESPDRSTTAAWGICKKVKICPKGMAYRAELDKCVHLYTRGPCPKGKLLYAIDGLAKCICDIRLGPYYNTIHKTCYEFFTRGQCSIKGLLLLPDGVCDCKPHLPHYHLNNGQCYELGTRGPCPPGNIYTISKDDKSKFKHGECVCKDGYVRWLDGICYRLYTKGPCSDGDFIINNSLCVRNYCGKGQLYFPNEKKCYKIGTQGPCNTDSVVIFDFRVRPSIDGLSYNGICGCSGIIKNLDQKCTKKYDNLEFNKNCDVDGMGKINGNCYKLYSKGPCNHYEWVEPTSEINSNNNALCKCYAEPSNINVDLCGLDQSNASDKLDLIMK